MKIKGYIGVLLMLVLGIFIFIVALQPPKKVDAAQYTELTNLITKFEQLTHISAKATVYTENCNEDFGNHIASAEDIDFKDKGWVKVNNYINSFTEKYTPEGYRSHYTEAINLTTASDGSVTSLSLHTVSCISNLSRKMEILTQHDFVSCFIGKGPLDIFTYRAPSPISILKSGISPIPLEEELRQMMVLKISISQPTPEKKVFEFRSPDTNHLLGLVEYSLQHENITRLVKYTGQGVKIGEKFYNYSSSFSDLLPVSITEIRYWKGTPYMRRVVNFESLDTASVDFSAEELQIPPKDVSLDIPATDWDSNDYVGKLEDWLRMNQI